MLTEIKTDTLHYFVDEHNLRQGEYKYYHDNGQLYIHTFCINDTCHGEYKTYHWNGQLDYATFFYQDNDLNVNPDTLTEQDRVYIMMSGRLPIRGKTV